MKKMTKKIQNMINITKKMTNKEFVNFMKYIDSTKFNKDEIDYIAKEQALKNLHVTTASNISYNWVAKEYKKEINKITFLLNNDDLLKKLGKISILLYGPTGTGKTTLINEILNINKNHLFEKMNLESIISSKMGQTQINLLLLVEKLNASNNKKKIIFIDEIDSIVNDRTSINDVGEHSRIVSTFIKFLDMLTDSIVIIAATNVENKIDPAIMRRFNIRIKSRKIIQEIFLDMIFKNKELNFSSQEISFIKLGLTRETFTISEFDMFVKNVIIESKIDPLFNSLEGFLKFFKDSISYKGKSSISKRKQQLLKKVGLHV